MSLRKLRLVSLLIDLDWFISVDFASEHGLCLMRMEQLIELAIRATHAFKLKQSKYNHSWLLMKKPSEFKLPEIKKNPKESVKQLSKTVIDSSATPKTRPASSQKVEDLQKKLFSKLEDYEHVPKKVPSRRPIRQNKDTTNQSTPGTESTGQGFEKMQKLMPALYSKLIDNKKSVKTVEPIVASFQPQASFKSQNLIRKESNQQKVEIKVKEEKKNEIEANPLFLAAQNPIQNQQNEIIDFKMSKEQINEMYRMYAPEDEEIFKATSCQDMQQLGNSIMFCELEIENIRKSMEGLIRTINIEFPPEADSDEEKQ